MPVNLGKVRVIGRNSFGEVWEETASIPDALEAFVTAHNYANDWERVVWTDTPQGFRQDMSSQYNGEWETIDFIMPDGVYFGSIEGVRLAKRPAPVRTCDNILTLDR